MYKTTFAALAAASLLSLAACNKAPAANDAPAATPAAVGTIDGTWKADLASVEVDSKPTEYLLQNGTFTCPTCTPPLTVAADGAFHSVTRPYSDMMSVKIDDDHTVTQNSKKGGQAMGMTKYTVAPDGKKLTVEFTDSSIANAKPVTGSTTSSRVADGPKGAHLLSGSWKLDQYNNVSDEGLTVTFKTDGDMFHMSAPSGVSYDAKVGGPAVPIKGDPAATTAMVTKSGDSYVETDARDGKVVSVTTFTPGADGKLHAVSEDKRDGSTVKYDATRL